MATQAEHKAAIDAIGGAQAASPRGPQNREAGGASDIDERAGTNGPGRYRCPTSESPVPASVTTVPLLGQEPLCSSEITTSEGAHPAATPHAMDRPCLARLDTALSCAPTRARTWDLRIKSP